jgi:hypothetical protein
LGRLPISGSYRRAAAEHRGADVLAPVNGLGASVSVEREDALLRLAALQVEDWELASEFVVLKMGAS